MSMTVQEPTNDGNKNAATAPATVIVIFGASGDLAARKLMPAIYNLEIDGLLPEDFYLIGYGRKEIENAAFRQMNAENVRSYSRREFEDENWGKIERGIEFHSGGYDDLDSFKRLASRIEQIEGESGRGLQVLFYVSTPPGVFGDILENLGKSGLASRGLGTRLASRVIVEKPFGRDLQSARDLNALIRERFEEEQVYRIDHYLGKETVQDLLVQRFANSIFEPIWNHKYVSYVEITVAESIGIGGRGGYYDQNGALRDMLQNHAMQLLSLVAMEPPIDGKAESIRDEKVKLLKAIQPVNLEGNNVDVVRGQYLGGGEKLGYLQEEGIEEGSSTETYAALRLWIDNWRWHGVPFYIRSGKRMKKRVSEIAIHFDKPPGSLFDKGGRDDMAPNALVIQIQPDEGSTLILNSKVPGLENGLQPIRMDFQYRDADKSETPEAYERLILDAILGDSTLFIRGDETEVSWELYTPILEHWERVGAEGLENYETGSWGPEVADSLLKKRGHMWRVPGS